MLALISQVVFHSSIDPTEQSFAVTLHNDTPSAVILKQCDAKCDSFHEQDDLLPGASVRVNTSGGNLANWWTIADPDGQTIGCLPLRYDHKIAGLVVNVSGYTTCPVGTSASSSSTLGSVIGFALFFLVAGISVAGIVFTTIYAHPLDHGSRVARLGGDGPDFVSRARRRLRWVADLRLLRRHP